MRTTFCGLAAFLLPPGPFASPPSFNPPAKALVQKAFEGIDPALRMDYHLHLAGLGAGGTECRIHPKYRTIFHPVNYAKMSIYLGACGVATEASADQEFMVRLLERIRGEPMPGRFLALALDWYHDSLGRPAPDRTQFYVPDTYVFEMARRHPDLFVPAISVHPRRNDALSALEQGAAAGARAVKWLPNAMGIDPADPANAPFYDKMRALELVLLSHAGEEKAIDAKDQRFGNPLRLRAPLDHGVKVLVAHCASLGKGRDLDAPGEPRVDNFKLFLRLMGEKKYDGLVFGEISSVTQSNRGPGPLRELLKRKDLHGRLVNGSDYPIPAVNLLIRLKPLVKAGFLRPDETEPLKEIFDHNPLLFDFVLKRTLRSPDTGERFPASMFTRHSALF